MSVTQCAHLYNWNQLASKLKTVRIHSQQPIKIRLIIISYVSYDHVIIDDLETKFELLNTKVYYRQRIPQ